jgi:hypothetical protein
MKGKFFLVLFVTIMIGIQPVFAQFEFESSAKSEAPEETVDAEVTTININLVSDSEFTQALQAAGDIELVNE